jgi:hypothetical protein
LIRGDVLTIHSNYDKFPDNLGSKYDIRLENLLYELKERGVIINHHTNEEDNVTLELAYDSIVNYFHIRKYENIPCVRCGKGVLIRRYHMGLGKSFLGCSDYPHCRKIVTINKNKKPRKR